MNKKTTSSKRPTITFNDAWESIPFDHNNDVLDFYVQKLQRTNPGKPLKLIPIAKCWRKYKYLVEDDANQTLWVFDLDRKAGASGKNQSYAKLIETQEELDAMLEADLKNWVQTMKEAGAWQEA